LLNNIDNAFSISIESLNVVDGFVAAGSFDIDILTAKQLYSIGQFTRIVGSNRLVIFDAYELASKSTSLRHERDFLNQNSFANLATTVMAYRTYRLREELMRDNILELLSFLLGDFLLRRQEITRLYEQRYGK
jgi:hypothetical protein